MKRAIKIVAIGFFSVILIALIAIIMLPNEYNVENKIIVNKPIHMVYNKMSDFSNWTAWSVWYQYDKDGKYSNEGEMGEVGSKLLWEGDTVGVGYQELSSKEQNKYFKAKLVFTSPFENKSEFSILFKEVGDNTEITWVNTGEYGFGIQRIMGNFMLDQLKSQFDQGLSNFKKWIEKMPTEPNINMKIVDVKSNPYYYIEEVAGNAPNEISEKLANAFQELQTFADLNAIRIIGAPFAVTIEFNQTGWKFQAGIPVEKNELKPSGRIKAGTTYSGKAIRTIYVGPYNEASVAYQKIDEYTTKNPVEFSWHSFEVYVSDPKTTPPDKIETHIYFPIK